MKPMGLLTAASLYSKSFRWNAGPKQLQLLPNMFSTRPKITRVYGAHGATPGNKLLMVACEHHAVAYGNLDYATPCLAYSSGILAPAQMQANIAGVAEKDLGDLQWNLEERHLCGESAVKP